MRAIRWWEGFLEEHRTRFPTGDGECQAGASLHVVECGRGDEDGLLPIASPGVVAELGAIIERCGSYTPQ